MLLNSRLIAWSYLKCDAPVHHVHQGPPRYLFSTEFAERNKDLMEDLTDLTDLLDEHDHLGECRITVVCNDAIE